MPLSFSQLGFACRVNWSKKMKKSLSHLISTLFSKRYEVKSPLYFTEKNNFMDSRIYVKFNKIGRLEDKHNGMCLPAGNAEGASIYYD